MKKTILMICFCLFAFCSVSLAATRQIYEDFNGRTTDDGWYASAGFSNRDCNDSCGGQPGIAYRWTIVTSGCYEGQCAQSEAPCGTQTGCSSQFRFSPSWAGWGKDIFIRFRAKFNVGYPGQCVGGRLPDGLTCPFDSVLGYTDSDCYLQFNWGTGFGYNYPWHQWSACPDPGDYSNEANITADNAWHEYAILLRSPTSSGQNATFMFWVDQTTYTSGTASAVEIAPINGYFSDPIYFMDYFKSPANPDDYLFWVDNVEVWDGIPDGGDTTDPTCTITTNSGSNYSTSTMAINLAGTSSDDVLVSSVAWSCATCTPTIGSASGTTSWTITSGQLALGANTITVTATDSSSNTGNDSIVITYSPPSAQGCTISGGTFR